MKQILLLIIRGYQLVLSPMLGSHCRFYPSCSCYSHDAIEAHGAIKGMYFSIRRISRCHPWSEGGFDPVPEVNNNKKK